MASISDRYAAFASIGKEAVEAEDVAGQSASGLFPERDLLENLQSLAGVVKRASELVSILEPFVKFLCRMR